MPRKIKIKRKERRFKPQLDNQGLPMRDWPEKEKSENRLKR